MIGDIRNLRSGVEADALGVARFSSAMTEKLSRKRKDGRGGWNRPSECSTEDLCVMLADHVKKGDMVDIANFCMFIWNRNNPRRADENAKDAKCWRTYCESIRGKTGE